MSSTAILQQALLLTPEERVQLCEDIWQSLEGFGQEVENELRERVEDIQLHPEAGISLEDWREEILVTRSLKL